MCVCGGKGGGGEEGGGGGAKNPPTGFSHLTSTNVGIFPQNSLNFSFNFFATLV